MQVRRRTQDIRMGGVKSGCLAAEFSVIWSILASSHIKNFASQERYPSCCNVAISVITCFFYAHVIKKNRRCNWELIAFPVCVRLDVQCSAVVHWLNSLPAGDRHSLFDRRQTNHTPSHHGSSSRPLILHCTSRRHRRPDRSRRQHVAVRRRHRTSSGKWV